jgi:hypothetical protein
MPTKILNDITISDPPAQYDGKSNANMIILGGGRTVWEDYFFARSIMSSAEIMCINDIGTQFKAEHIHHMVSLHVGFFPATKLLRREKGLLHKYVNHCTVKREGVDVVWRMQNAGGTSGLFATKIALAMGSKKIILCGIPMDNTGHYFDPPEAEKNRTTKFSAQNSTLAPWRDMKKSKLVMDRVRSMGGHTAGIFGKPTKEWVQS